MDTFLHALYMKHYGNRANKKPREVCIRCGSRAILGTKGKWLGLCKKCRKLEFKAVLVILLMLIAPQISFGATASWYDSDSINKEGTCKNEKCYTASGKEIHQLEKKGTLFCATNDYRLGTTLRVCDVKSKRCVVVKAYDRGGFKKYGRSVDLCKRAFSRIAPIGKGITEVSIEVVK